ncbi:OsmC family protein [Bacteroidota bacterium]
MKTISKWIHENQFLIHNDRNFLVSVTDPSDKSKYGDPTSWDLILMGFSGCVSAEFVKISNDKNLYFSEFLVEMKVNSKYNDKHISFDVILKIKTSAAEHHIQFCLNEAIKHCPLGILTSTIDIPINTHITIDRNFQLEKSIQVKPENIKKNSLQ